MCAKMSMYRSYLLKNNFWAKKGNEKFPAAEKVFIKHDSELEGFTQSLKMIKRALKLWLMVGNTFLITLTSLIPF